VGFTRSPAKEEKKAARRLPVNFSGVDRQKPVAGQGREAASRGRWGWGLYGARVEGTVGEFGDGFFRFGFGGELEVTVVSVAVCFGLHRVLVPRFRLIADSESTVGVLFLHLLLTTGWAGLGR
jgi:hypothetical protein